MNVCILMGKVTKEVEFKFVYNDKRISVAYTTIILLNKAKIKIKGYTEIADDMYRKLQIGDIVVIEGKVDSKMEIEVEKIRVVSHT